MTKISGEHREKTMRICIEDIYHFLVDSEQHIRNNNYGTAAMELSSAIYLVKNLHVIIHKGRLRDAQEGEDI